MDRGIYISTPAGKGQLQILEATTNNIATVNVPGAKKDFPVFSTYMAEANATGSVPNNQMDANKYVDVAQIMTDFSQGSIKATGNPMDVALNGEGFLVVKTDEGLRYTRKGDLAIDSQGVLTTKSGDPIEGEAGPITLTSANFTIDSEGAVSDGEGEVGSLKIVTFADLNDLKKAGDGLFAPKDDTKPLAELPADGTTLMQNHLEMSNANVVKEMVTMISALRSYESNMKLIQAYDNITEKVIGINNR